MGLVHNSHHLNDQNGLKGGEDFLGEFFSLEELGGVEEKNSCSREKQLAAGLSKALSMPAALFKSRPGSPLGEDQGNFYALSTP